MDIGGGVWSIERSRKKHKNKTNTNQSPLPTYSVQLLLLELDVLEAPVLPVVASYDEADVAACSVELEDLQIRK